MAWNKLDSRTWVRDYEAGTHIIHEFNGLYCRYIYERHTSIRSPRQSGVSDTLDNAKTALYCRAMESGWTQPALRGRSRCRRRKNVGDKYLCSLCKQMKHKSEFYWNYQRETVGSRCKPCQIRLVAEHKRRRCG